MAQHYVGTKIIEAWEQTKDGAEGYAVKYPDGYVSWSPKAVFEATYLPLGNISDLPPHVQRMHAEQAELRDRLHKLSSFLGTRESLALPRDTLDALYEQERHMVNYSAVLSRRVQQAQGREHEG